MKKLFLYSLLVVLAFSVLGCGGKHSKDDSDVEQNMNEAADGVFYLLRHEAGRETDPETGKEIIIYAETKYKTKFVDITLKDKETERKIYAVYEITYANTERNIPDDCFFAVFDDGDISLVKTDKNLFEEGVTSANLIEEELLCPSYLKQGLFWYCDNGYYNVVERYEYVMIESVGRSADSFRIVTYKDDTMSEKVREVWWTPEIAWFSQWKDCATGIVDTIYDLDYDWDDED